MEFIAIQKQYPPVCQCCHRIKTFCAERQSTCGNLPFVVGAPQVIPKDSISAENHKVTIPPRTYKLIAAAITVKDKRSGIP